MLGRKVGKGKYPVSFCLCAGAFRLARVETSVQAGNFFIFRLRMCIFRLKIYILSLRMCISNLRMKFLCGQTGFVSRASGIFFACRRADLPGVAYLCASWMAWKTQESGRSDTRWRGIFSRSAPASRDGCALSFPPTSLSLARRRRGRLRCSLFLSARRFPPLAVRFGVLSGTGCRASSGRTGRSIISASARPMPRSRM